jgi:membrane-bound ClpP family serine protease
MDITSFITNIGWMPIIFFILGLALLIFEMFHPGFHAPGITGIILLVCGIIFTAHSIQEALVMVVIIIAILGFALSMVLSSATNGRLSKTLVLSHTSKREAGYIGTEDLGFFLGKEGLTITNLRPSGTADFDGVKLDVVSQAEFIPKETKVIVMKVEGRRIVVCRLKLPNEGSR